MNKEKVLGVLGGMGPYATLYFLQKIYDCTPTEKEWEHIRIITDFNVKIPSRTRAILHNETSPVNYMIDSINQLNKIGADLVAIPCNSAHYFYESVSDKINIPWINMVKIVAEKIVFDGHKKVLILGGYVTNNKNLYSKYLKESVYLTTKENKIILEIIEFIKIHAFIDENRITKLKKLLQNTRNKYDSIILACTELSIIYNTILEIINVPVFDSTIEYAENIVSLIKEK